MASGLGLIIVTKSVSSKHPFLEDLFRTVGHKFHPIYEVSTLGKMFPMSILFCNIRGITAPSRTSCILDDTTKNLNLGCIGFIESKKESFTDSFLKSI